MISIDEAKALIDQHRPRPRTVHVPIYKAINRTLCEDIRATEQSPACDNSAMDGFAIRVEDGIMDASLRIIGESRAGSPFDKPVEPGTAVRINTGAKVPAGADTVVPIEDCLETVERIVVQKPVKRMQHIRRAGEEYTAGDMLLRAGTVLHAPQISLLAFTGINSVPVYQAPNVCVLVTGAELVSFGEQAKDFQIRDSNTPMLNAALHHAGVNDAASFRIKDDFKETVHAIRQADKEGDIILVTGGVSVGPHDHVKEAAQQCGFEQVFWKIRQKPGKPFFFAVKDGKLLFGLPGNPVSVFIVYMAYIDPLIRRLLNPSYQPITVMARPERAFLNKGKRTQLVRIALHQELNKRQFSVPAKQGSHMISSIANTNGYIILEPDEEITIDQDVCVQLYPWSI